MRLSKNLKTFIFGSSLVLGFSMHAQDVGEIDTWSVRPYVGYSSLSGFSGQSTGIGATDGGVDIDLDGGFLAGFGVDYRYNQSWSSEIAWEYRTNDSQTILADGDIYTEGNYASNIFFINGYYHFVPKGKWQAYMGGGLSWIQEVDIDLERNGTELSYSGDGDTGFQVFGGVNYVYNENWSLNGEIRYGAISGIELQGEEGAVGTFTDFEYKPLTLQIGMSYSF